MTMANGNNSAGQPPRALFPDVPVAIVGGLPLVALDCNDTASLMIDAAIARRGVDVDPILMSSANGEVLSRCARDPEIAGQFAQMELLNADGQPLVLASRIFSKHPLPERVATTDLFHYVARRAIADDVTFYMLGATPEENERALARVRQLYPALKILGASHGYHQGKDLERKVDEINALAPDILWVAFGVPHEQKFCLKYKSRLRNVGIIKTSGGLFNFLSGTRQRAPVWMQKSGLEWLYRLKEEPRRMFWRYALTNPHALYLLLRQTA